jgi:hypothetical protein
MSPKRLVLTGDIDEGTTATATSLPGGIILHHLLGYLPEVLRILGNAAPGVTTQPP